MSCRVVLTRQAEEDVVSCRVDTTGGAVSCHVVWTRQAEGIVVRSGVSKRLHFFAHLAGGIVHKKGGMLKCDRIGGQPDATVVLSTEKNDVKATPIALQL